MNKKSKNHLSLTVGITTCYGGASMLETVKSICASEGIGPFRFILIADRTPIDPDIMKQLRDMDVEVIWNKKEGSQFKKKKQILKLCDTDLIVFTNDDVLFGKDTLRTVVDEFQKRKDVTLISVYNQPISTNSLAERAISVGTNIVNRIAGSWNNGDNYLSVIGRFEATRTNWIKQYFELHDDVVSSDQYIYFENKKHGGVYRFLPNVSVYFKNPQTLDEQLRKSSRFQHSKMEMSRYFGYISKDYEIPRFIFLKAVVHEFFANPFFFLIYLFIAVYTKLFTIPPNESLNPNWQVDLSTKHIVS